MHHNNDQIAGHPIYRRECLARLPTSIHTTILAHMVEDLEKAASYAGSPVEWPTASLKGNKDHSSLVASSSEPRELGKEPATGSALEISIKDADVTLAFMLEHDAKVPPITPDQERALSRKIFLRVFSLTWVVCLVLYTDKATLSYSVRLIVVFEDCKGQLY